MDIKIKNHYMNPFDFVPLPSSPQAIPKTVLDEKRYEGYLTYSIEILTPIHISGKIESTGVGDNLHYAKRHFYRNKENEAFIIPASSIRGMLAAFIEAMTGSDFGAITIGDEGKEPYAKKYQERHVGFEMQAGDNPESIRDDKRKFERNITLPNGFTQRKIEDIARFMFGYVNQKEKEGELSDLEDNSQKGRLIFEDIVLKSDIKVIEKRAWDVLGAAAMGSPNPRANTAWYFTAGKPRIRDVNKGRFRVWEILADKVRGRKFYFHQYPDQCFNYYNENWRKPHRGRFGKNFEGWVNMIDYKVESVLPNQSISNGRIDFKDMPISLLKLLLYSLELEPSLAHKLGGLKPFGFGSIKIKVDELCYRATDEVFNDWITSREELNKLNILPLQYGEALKWIKQIMHFPLDTEKLSYLFIYPPYRQEPSRRWADDNNEDISKYVLTKKQKGFAQPEMIDRNDFKPKAPTPGDSQKTTLFFGFYQDNAINSNAVLKGLKHLD